MAWETAAVQAARSGGVCRKCGSCLGSSLVWVGAERAATPQRGGRRYWASLRQPRSRVARDMADTLAQQPQNCQERFDRPYQNPSMTDSLSWFVPAAAPSATYR